MKKYSELPPRYCNDRDELWGGPKKKGSVISLLYKEVREQGIKVAVILPGFVDTPMIPPVKHLDRSKMIQADDVAQAVIYVLNAPTTSCPVEIRSDLSAHRIGNWK